MTDRSSSGADVRVLDGEVRCVGTWTVDGLGEMERRLPRLAAPPHRKIVVDGSEIAAMDTAGAWVLHRVLERLERDGREVELRLRSEDDALLRIVTSSTASAGAPPAPERRGVLERVGRWAWHAGGQIVALVAFTGESAVTASRGFARPSRIRWRSLLHDLEAAGFRALPITGLLSFLMGIVISYQGAAQLRRYGASIFVADLVGLAMLREISPLVTAIIAAGRSGSAYAAQIGTMRVTEEIDAVRTVGIAPVELLVLPKIAALAIALPLLTVYADVLGVAGGMLMARSALAVPPADFLDRFSRAIRVSDYLVGVGKAPVFAAIIAVTGCYQGFQVTGDAESVGRRTTVSVVQSVFLVIVVDAVFSVLFSWLGI